jgi:hypothetical protein
MPVNEASGSTAPRPAKRNLPINRNRPKGDVVVDDEARPMTTVNRVRDIDFWRGTVLIVILVDHIPGNPLEHFTPRNFGLSDSAEAFVFLSGLSVGLIYLPRARKHGFAAAAGACLKRALKIYGVHIALTLAALVVFAVAYWLSGVTELIEAHGRSLVFGSPANGLLGLALLSHQLGYFNILPLYIVLMLWAPLAIALAQRTPLLALTVSAGLYAAARAFDLNLPNWPQPGGWFFNPFAWQLVFTMGVVAALVPQRSSAALVLGACIERGGSRRRGAGRDKRRRPGAGPSRGHDRASRCRQAGSRIGATRSFHRSGLPCRRGARSWANGRQSRPRRYRRRGSKPGPQ